MQSSSFSAWSKGHSIPWRLRSDLGWHQQNGSATSSWVVHDPLTNRYLRLGEEERTLLGWLDGKASLQDVSQRFCQAFAPLSMEPADILRLIQLAVQNGLLVYRGEAKGGVAIAWRSPWMVWLQQLPWKLLTSRIVVWRPAAWLERRRGTQWFFFAPRNRVYWCGFIGLAWIATLRNGREAMEQLPAAHLLWAPQSLIGMGVAFLITKLVHELGHALACTHAGARCKEFGLLITMGSVCPYADVTDSWRVANRWERAWIALAGIYAEWILASCAALFWCFTHAGAPHDFAWKIVVVSSISTLLFNANPLVKYDGYYALSDLLGIANLRERADRQAASWMARMILGKTQETQPKTTSWRWIGYSMFAWGYRAMLTGSMALALIACGRAWQMETFGVLLAGLLVLSVFGVPAVQFVQRSRVAMQSGTVGRWRASLGWTAMISLAVLLAIVPLPFRIQGFAILQPHRSWPVYATTDGVLLESSSGSAARAINDQSVLFRFSNPRLEDSVIQCEQQVFAIDEEIRLAKRALYFDPKTAEQLPVLESIRQVAESTLENRRHLVEELTVRSPADGVWLPAPIRRDPLHSPQDVQQQEESARPMEEGEWISTGALLGWVLQEGDWIGHLYVDEKQLREIAIGMHVRIFAQSDPWRPLRGMVEHVAFDPEEMAASQDVELRTSTQRLLENAKSNQEARVSRYQVQIRIPLNEIPSQGLKAWTSATVAIEARQKCLAQYVIEWCHVNIRLF